MPAAVPVVAAAAGSYAAGAGLATAAFGILPWSVTAAVVNGVIGFGVSTAINALGSRAVKQKPRTPNFSATAQGRAIVVRSSIESHKIIYGQARVSGPLAYANAADSVFDNFGNRVYGTNKFLHLVIPVAGHEVDSIPTIYINETPVTLNADGWCLTAPYFDGSKSYVRITKNLGAPDQAADTVMTSQIVGWSNDHRLRGLAYLYVMLEFDNDVFPTGIPDISAVVKGKKVYDPRTSTTAWSDNAALCIRDYLTSDYGFGCSSDEVNDTYFNAAANACEESVTLLSGSTQDRYTCNGVVDTGVAPLENLNQLVTSLAGAVTYVQGAFRLHAGEYDSPAGTLNESHLAGPIRIQARTPRKELFNAVKGTYLDPNRNWQPTDFSPITNSTYETQDGGERIYQDIELAFTDDPERAQRIAKILLEKGRQGIKIEMPVNHNALQYAVMDVVNVTNEAMGWSSKPFRILKWSMEPPTIENAGGIILTMQEESSASYDWAAGDASELDAAPDTNLPSAFNVVAPGTPEIAEELYETRDSSGVKTKAIVTWQASDDAFLREYQLEYKLSSASAYTVLPRITSTAHEILDIASGIYDFRVKAINGLGVSSTYSTFESKEIVGLGARPVDITNFTIQAISGLVVARWDQHPDLDVRIGGRILIRHSNQQSGATWNNSVSIGEAIPGNANMAVLPLKAGTYLAKAEDAIQLLSENAVSATINDATVQAFTVISSTQEDPDFTGSHSGTTAVDSVLKLSGAGSFDDIADFDAVNNLDSYGGITSSGTYTHAERIDLVSKSRVRLEATLEVAASNVNDQIDSRTNNIDEWEDFDGNTAGATVDAWVEVRSTDDDPDGMSPTWSEWNRLHVGEYHARGFEFRTKVTTDDPAYNILISQLRIEAKEIT